MSSVGATCIRHLTISFCFQSWSAQPFDHLNIFVSVVESILIFFLVAGQISIPYIRMNQMMVLYLLTLLAHFLSRKLGSALVQCWPSINRAPLSPAIYPRYLLPFTLLSFLPEIPFMMSPRSFVIIALVLPLFTLSLPTQNYVNAVQRWFAGLAIFCIYHWIISEQHVPRSFVYSHWQCPWRLQTKRNLVLTPDAGQCFLEMLYCNPV